MTKATTELDNPWKDIIALYFEAFTVFFFPKVHKLIDWSRGYEFMDHELLKVVRDAEMKRRLADKLVKVWLKDGQETILYIHVEVQGQKDKLFEQRIFIYNYRLFDRYGPSVISLAILGDENSDWRPQSYSYGLAGFKMSCQFPTVKLIDYRKKWKTLEKSQNPFAIVVQTHLKSMETRDSANERFEEKKELFKALHEANYSEQQILDLFRFMDLVLGLPKGLEQQFNDFTTQYEEDRKMPYVTSIERQCRREGRKEGIQFGALQNARKNVVENLRVRFKRVPQALIKLIQAIEDKKLLSKLLKEAILVDSLKSFRQLVEKNQANALDSNAEARKMPDLTSIEREDREEGIQIGALQTARENVVEVLRVRFKRVPQSLIKLIQAIEDEKFLSKLLKEAILVDSLKSFRQLVDKKPS